MQYTQAFMFKNMHFIEYLSYINVLHNILHYLWFLLKYIIHIFQSIDTAHLMHICGNKQLFFLNIYIRIFSSRNAYLHTWKKYLLKFIIIKWRSQQNKLNRFEQLFFLSMDERWSIHNTYYINRN